MSQRAGGAAVVLLVLGVCFPAELAAFPSARELRAAPPIYFQATAGIEAQVVNARGRAAVRCLLYPPESTWGQAGPPEPQLVSAPIHQGRAYCAFYDVKPGLYRLVITPPNEPMPLASALLPYVGAQVKVKFVLGKR